MEFINDNNDDIWNDESNDIIIASRDINVMITSMRQSGYRQGLNLFNYNQFFNYDHYYHI